MKVLVFMYADRHTSGVRNLERSLNKYGWSYEIVGKDAKFEDFSTTMKVFRMKLQEVISLSDGDDTLVIKLDAFDVLCVRNQKDFIDFIEVFYESVAKRRLIVGAEYTILHPLCFGNSDKYHEYHGIDRRQLNFPYMNAGCLAGTPEQLLAFYEHALSNGFVDDQIALIKYANQYPERIYLDTETHLFYNHTEQTKSLVFEATNIYSKYTKHRPFFLHVPGMHKDLFGRYNKNLSQVLNDNDGVEYLDPESSKGFRALLITFLVLLGLFLGSLIIVNLWTRI